MNSCPVCKAPVEDTAEVCPKCGVIFEKWRAKVAAAVIAMERMSGERRKRRPFTAIVVVMTVLYLAAIWLALSMTRMKAGSRGQGQRQQEGGVPPSVAPTAQEATPSPAEPLPEGMAGTVLSDPVSPEPAGTPSPNY